MLFPHNTRNKKYRSKHSEAVLNILDFMLTAASEILLLLLKLRTFIEHTQKKPFIKL